MPIVKRAEPSVALSFTRTPAYSSSSRIVSAFTLEGLNANPSTTSRLAIARTRSATCSGSLLSRVACRSMSLVGRRAAKAASRTPPFSTKSSRYSHRAIRLNNPSSAYKVISSCTSDPDLRASVRIADVASRAPLTSFAVSFIEAPLKLAGLQVGFSGNVPPVLVASWDCFPALEATL